MPGEMIKIVSMQGDSFSAYLARPVQPTGPGIVILNELFDINPWIKRIADEFSERGYLVCVPDLFWRSHNTLFNDANNRVGFRGALKYCAKQDRNLAVSDVERVMEKLQSHPNCNGKIASVGFSMGGTLSYLAAARLEPDAAVVYYGTHIQDHLDEGKNINCQTLLHMGKYDINISAEENQKIHAALIGKFNIAIYKYDTGHTFANSDDSANFHSEAAALAHKRSFDLLDNLK